MATNISSLQPSSARPFRVSIDPNGDESRSSDVDHNVPQGSSDDAHYTALSLTIPVPNEILRSVSIISSSLDRWIPAERHHIKPIVVVVCLETAFLKWIRRSNEDVLSILFFSFLLGSFAWPAWTNLKRMRCQLDDLSGRIELLQFSIKSLESTLVGVLPAESIRAPAVPDVPLLPTEDHPQMGTSKSIVKPVVKPVDPGQTRPVQPPAVADKPLHPPYDLRATPERVESPVVIENLPIPPAAPWPDAGNGVEIQGLTDNIMTVSDIGTAGSSVEQPRSKSRVQPAPPPKSAVSPWLPALHEIKQRIEQFTEGKLERMSHLSQNVTSNLLSLRRCGVRLLMSAASLPAADFASPVGYLGSSESTPYYPTGDLQDRNIAFTNAMDCVDHLEDDLHGNDDVRIATKLFELAQALSDLGLHEYALNTSGFALDALERLFTAAPDDSRLHLASILSLRANILCDLKRNDEARDTADRAVSLCKEHRDSQTAPVPELAYALLNYAVLLNSIGHKDGSAAVAFELLTDADETQPDMKDVSALCNLCLSNTRIGTDDETALPMAEEAIELTRTSSDVSSQTVLAGALLDKSRILSSRGQNDAAVSLSAEAVTILRSMSATRPVFSLFLAYALDVHAHTLSEADRKAESYAIVQNAVELWQTLKISAPGPIARPLAWALFHLAKFRYRGGERNALREEFRIAESAVNAFREVEPLDAPGLAEALFLYADRMLELDKNREAATYAEESVQYFREALEEDQKYALDLIFSLSLASSCLACTERGGDAFEYAKQAVEVQHGRKNAEDPQYEPHLRKLLMDVVFRATENEKPAEAAPWFYELQSLEPSGEESVGPLARRSDTSQRQGGEFKKETSYWMDANAGAQGSGNGPASAPAASSSTLSIDKGKGKEVSPSPEVGRSTPRIDKGKAKEVNINTVFDPSTEEIFSPGAAAAAQRGRAGGLGNAGPLMGNNILGGGGGGSDLLSGLLGLGGGGMGGGGGGIGMNGVPGGSGRHPGGGHSNGMDSWSGMGGLRSFGDSINDLTENVLGNLRKLGADGQGQGGGDDGSNANGGKTDNRNGDTSARGAASSSTHNGTWSGMGIQSRLSDNGT